MTDRKKEPLDLEPEEKFFFGFIGCISILIVLFWATLLGVGIWALVHFT